MPSYRGIVEGSGGARLDIYVAETLGLLTRSQLKNRLRSASVNGKPARLSRAVHMGDLLELAWENEPFSGTAAQDIHLEILYENGRVIVIDKPQGMVTHPAHGNWMGTLANALAGRKVPAAPDFRPPERAGIVHRLDKDTSGVIIAAKDAEAQEYLASQFRNRRVLKEYIAITSAPLPAPSGRICGRMGRVP
ncbi:MAG TPA: RluA family pseudouridine synthase, partial [Magnetospirillaceae bacterium]|nr:RluA family pseudouridine synthase [Magnetospirillaceae bacterium]